MAARDYAGGAVATTLSTGIGSSDTTISIQSSTGWPTGSGGKFYITIDRLGTPEKVLVLSRSGTTLTLSGAGDRGVDGTSPAAHLAGVTVEHTIATPDVSEPNAHINNTALDHHTQYLNTTRHDVTARHTAGTVVPTASAGTIQPDDAAAEGTAGTLARSDHKHQIVAATAGSIQPDDAAAEGVATSFARSDHKHSIVSGAPVASAPGDAQAEGVSTGFARDDHKHAREAFAGTGDIADLALTEAAGSAATVPHGDHQHQFPATLRPRRIHVAADTPSSPVEGDERYDTDTDYIRFYDGSAWQIQLVAGAWTAYTPGDANITVGNGTRTAAYWRAGKLVCFRWHLVLGSTSAIGTGPSVGMPTSSRTGATTPMGMGGCTAFGFDASAVAPYVFGASIGSNVSAAAIVLTGSGGGLPTATVPFTWTTSDELLVVGMYESS